MAAFTARSLSAIPTTPRAEDIGALKTLGPRLVPQILEDDQTMRMPGASVHRKKGTPSVAAIVPLGLKSDLWLTRAHRPSVPFPWSNVRLTRPPDGSDSKEALSVSSL